MPQDTEKRMEIFEQVKELVKHERAYVFGNVDRIKLHDFLLVELYRTNQEIIARLDRIEAAISKGKKVDKE